MIAKGTNYATEWNDSLNVAWKTDLTGDGWSSPIVCGNRVFLTSVFLEKAARKANSADQQTQPPPPPAPGGQAGQQGTPPPPQAPDDSYKQEVYRWELTCFDLNSGKEMWKQVAYKGAPRIRKHQASNYACETPVTDGKRIYAYWGMLGVYCYDLNGKLIWHRDLGAYETMKNWGTGSSPVIYNDLLYIQVDNEENSFLVALDAATGTEKWKVNRDEKTNYATPVIWKTKFGPELVTIGKYARSYDPETGKAIWALNMGDGMTVPSAVYDEEHIYVGKAGGPNKPGILFSVKAGSKGDITPADSALVSNGVEWTIRNAGIANPSPLLFNGLIYLLSSRGGEICCHDAATGALVYKNKIANVGACWATPWVQGDKIYFYDEKGITQVIQAGKDFKPLSKNTLNDKFWASVAITDDAYIFRGVKKLYCVKK
jgi:FOG: WD40-like repeat